MDNNRPNNARKGGDRKNQSNSRVDVNDENKQPSHNSAKNGVRPTEKRSDTTLLKGPQATAEQLRMAQMSQVSSASDVVLSDMIKQVCELTGCSEDDAVTALHDTANDPEAAVNLVLEGGANKSEWETTGKKGKKKPKAKPEEVNESGLENPVFGGYVRTTQTASNRGRGAQRNTSNRGGRGGGTPSAPRGGQQDDSANFDGGSNRTFPSTGDRPASPKVNRPNREDDSRGRGPLDSKKPEQHERLWGEDADDDWKEAIRETKVFTRSAPTAPTSISQPQPVPSRVQQPAAVGASNSPSFSAMVQKQSQQAAWTNSSAAPTSNALQRQPVNDVSNWKQTAPSSTSSPQKPSVAQGPVANHTTTVGQGAPAQSHPIAAASQKEPPPDMAQVGMQFNNMSFSRTTYEARTEQPSQASIPSQSQTFSSRTTLPGGHPSRDQVSGDQLTSHRPAAAAYPSLSPGDSSRSQNVSGLGGSYVLPTQPLNFGHSDQDVSTNTYSAKNIQSSAVFTNSQQPSLPSRSPSGSFPDSRLNSNAAPGAQNSANSSVPGGSVTSLQDSRFSQQQPSTSSALSKSPQNPPGRSEPVAFSGAPQQKTQSLSQSPSIPTDQQQYSQQSAAHQSVPSMRQGGGYSSYGLSGDGGVRSNYSAFSNPTQPASLNPAQKDGSISLQQHQQQQQPSQQQSVNSSTISGAAPRTSTSTSVFNTGSKPSPVPSSSLAGFKASAYPTQPNPAATQSLLNQQQHYLPQGQQYNQPTSLPMFQQMYGGLDGMNDPRLQSVMQQPNIGLDYNYQTPLTSRDPSGLGYSASDPNKYRSDPMAGVQTQVSQQGLVSQLHGGPYQSYMYTPAAVAQNYGYGPSPVYQQPTLPSTYKGGSLGSTYPGSGYQDMNSLSDVGKGSNAYGSSGLRGFNDGYGNQGILGGSTDLNSAYYGSNKPVNKQFEKPSPNFGMHLPSGGQQNAGAYANQYYSPLMPTQQQQLHQMGQGQQNSVGQNLGNNNKSKGPTNQSYGQSWGHQ